MGFKEEDQWAKRFLDLAEYIKPYLEGKKQMQSKEQNSQDSYIWKDRLLKELGGTERDWALWKWHISHRLTDLDLIADLYQFTPTEKQEMESVTLNHRMAISPFLVARLTSKASPLARQFLPSVLEVKHFCDGLGSQSVLLREINDSAFVLRYLYQSLLAIGVRPYYLFHAKNISGTTHFRTSVAEGVHLIESLRGFTSGLAIPSYVVNMPGGLGKVPLLPQTYRGSLDDDPILFRTWENKMVAYDNKDSYLEVTPND